MIQIIVSSICLLGAASSTLRGFETLPDVIETRAWISDSSRNSWPEDSLPEMNVKESTGIVMNGGGARAFTASIGYLAGLQKLGLLANVKYISGVSGGAWATTSFAYTSVQTELFLGPVTDPVDINMEFLRSKGVEGSIRTAFAEKNFVTTMALKVLTNGLNLKGAWIETVEDIVMKQAGVDSSKVPAVSSSDADANADSSLFITHDLASKPFPIIGITIVSPDQQVRRPDNTDAYSLLEATPMYIGVAGQRTVAFPTINTNCIWNCQTVENVDIGGFVEPIAFGSLAPKSGLGHQIAGFLTVPRPQSAFTLGHMVGASSYVPGAVFTSLNLLKVFDFSINYWSPTSDQPVNVQMAVGDGGSVGDVPIISLLRRGLKSIVVFGSFDAPLPTREEWDPRLRTMKSGEVERTVSALFGNFDTEPALRMWDDSRNVVFPTADFVPLIMALQDAAASGNGAVVTMEHTTVQNDWWGIPAGLKVRVTWVYTARLTAWEAQLPAEVRSQLADDKGFAHGKVKTGVFEGFPFYNTFAIHPSREQANLLAEMCGALVLTNADLFRKALSTA